MVHQQGLGCPIQLQWWPLGWQSTGTYWPLNMGRWKGPFWKQRIPKNSCGSTEGSATHGAITPHCTTSGRLCETGETAPQFPLNDSRCIALPKLSRKIIWKLRLHVSSILSMIGFLNHGQLQPKLVRIYGDLFSVVCSVVSVNDCKRTQQTLLYQAYFCIVCPGTTNN